MLKLATYNIHRCIGRDGRYDPGRVREVLRMTDAHLIALQEVELFHDDPGLLDFLCDGGPWQAIQGITMTRQSGKYGNAVLSRLPVLTARQVDISHPGREPRGAVHVRVAFRDEIVGALATHLGLRPVERRDQARQLVDVLGVEAELEPKVSVTVLMGDLNEWFIWGRPLRWLRRHFQLDRAPHPATYPSRRPLFALDRIWVDPAERLISVYPMRNELTRQASDHLPLIAEIGS